MRAQEGSAQKGLGGVLAPPLTQTLVGRSRVATAEVGVAGGVAVGPGLGTPLHLAVASLSFLVVL